MAKLINITAPTFTINGEVYNEYELRSIFLEVAKGNLPTGLVVVDCKGNTSTILERGVCSDRIAGLDALDEILYELCVIRMGSSN
jgi:hypothetical protein